MNDLPCQRKTIGVFPHDIAHGWIVAVATDHGVYHAWCNTKGYPVPLLPCIVDQICPACGKPIVEQNDDGPNLFDGELYRCLERVESIAKGIIENSNWQNWNYYRSIEWHSEYAACKAWSDYRRMWRTINQL